MMKQIYWRHMFIFAFLCRIKTKTLKNNLLLFISFLFVAWFYNHDVVAQTATIDLSSEKQTIRGFGGINHPCWGVELTDAQVQTAFGNGDGELGFSVLRIYVNDDSNSWYRELNVSKKAAKLGAIIFATPWNPPTDMTETVTRNNRTEKRLKYDCYQKYTDHLNNFNNYMKNNGVSLHAISFANEPDYGHDWTWYSTDEVLNYTKNYAGKLRINNTKVITAESFAYAKSYYNGVLNDATALSNIDIIGTHFYASDANTSDSFFQYALADQKAPSKERWMTEHYTTSETSTSSTVTADLWPLALDVSYEIHRAMVEGNFSAYVWWYIRRHYGPIKEDGSISKRGYCMAQYAKFVRPGYVRVEADKNPTYNVYVSAYKKENDVVIVAVNRSTVSKTLTFSVPDTKVVTWNQYVTSETKNVAKGSDISAPNGSFQITLEPQSTTTFVGMAQANSLPDVELTLSDSISVAPASISMEAVSTNPNVTVAHIDFYANDELLQSEWVAPYSFDWTNVEAGIYTIKAIVYDEFGNTAADSATLIVNVPQSPYGGKAYPIPGTIEAEDYDLGGEGFAYHDLSAGNAGEVYRSEDVDITGDAVDGYKIGWTIAGEWLEYTVDVEETAVYNYSAIVSSGNKNSSFLLLLDGQVIADTIHVPQGADWDTYTTVKGKTSALTEGEHVLRLVIDGSYCNIDKIIFEKESENVGLNETPLSEVIEENFNVYSVLGEYRGEVNLSGKGRIQDELSRLNLQQGVYLLKSKNSKYSYLISYQK